MDFGKNGSVLLDVTERNVTGLPPGEAVYSVPFVRERITRASGYLASSAADLNRIVEITGGMMTPGIQAQLDDIEAQAGKLNEMNADIDEYLAPRDLTASV